MRRRRGLSKVVRPHERSDAELLGSIQSDPGAFTAFYDRYETAIVGDFLRRTKDVELAADLTAEVFAAALSAAARYRPENATAAPWLFTIAQHTLARSLRRGRVEARARRRLGIREAFELEDSQIDQVQAARCRRAMGRGAARGACPRISRPRSGRGSSTSSPITRSPTGCRRPSW